MNLLSFLPIAAIALVIWCGRRIPLSGWRKRAAILARAAAVAALCATLLGGSRVRTAEATATRSFSQAYCGEPHSNTGVARK